MSAVRELSWEPRRRGPIYCASACGANCTKADFDKATHLAKKLCARLGKGWEPRVHENMGWFAAVLDATGCWYVTIHQGAFSRKCSYTAFLGTPYSHSGKWAETADTPEAAMDQVRKAATEYLRKLKAMLDAAGVKP